MASTRNLQKNHTRGFTLIELLVVIAIIGLLSAVVLASLNTARAKGRDAQRQSNLTNLQQALALYYTDNGSYPVTNGYVSQCAGWGGVAANSVIPGLVPTYIGTMPADPAMKTSGNTDCLIYISNGTDYKLLDYNMIDSTNPGAHEALIDPERNYGQSYARPPGCSGTETTVTWAIWSSQTAACQW